MNIEYQNIIIATAAFLASSLTFFSGFGLGTIFTPVFALFFPLPVSIGLTAIVHITNNFFKLSITYKDINREVLAKFGFPAIVASAIGAYTLMHIDNNVMVTTLTIMGKNFPIYLLNMILGFLILFFVILDLMPSIKNLQVDKDKMIFGGVLSGFFGGLSGHQGAFRSIFLIKAGLTKESFIATGIAIACMIDMIRLPIYYFKGSLLVNLDNVQVLLIAIVSATSGAYLGSIYFKKTTYESIQLIVSLLLIFIAIFILLGLGH